MRSKARVCLTCKNFVILTNRKTKQTLYYCRLKEKLVDPSDLCNQWES